MTDRQLVDTKNLDRYGDPPLPWSRPLGVLDQIAPSEMLTWFLGTVRPDGRPHTAGVGALWHDGDLYFTSGPGTQKSRESGGQPCGDRVRPPGRHRPGLRRNGDQGHRARRRSNGSPACIAKVDGRRRSRMTPSRLPSALPAPARRRGISIDSTMKPCSGSPRLNRTERLAGGSSADQAAPPRGRSIPAGRKGGRGQSRMPW